MHRYTGDDGILFKLHNNLNGRNTTHKPVEV